MEDNQIEPVVDRTQIRLEHPERIDEGEPQLEDTLEPEKSGSESDFTISRSFSEYYEDMDLWD